MANDKTIPESIRSHLSQIAERLWSDRAVVMVGAGFSKNASRDYPDWAQLGDKLYEKAHGKSPTAENKSYISLLKVAEETEAIIGRPALDALLKSDIPDLSVEPSTLHVGLLNLPWADVLTTNYDTLLERACRKVIKHRYSIVVNQNDLPYAEKPRIIKLHGSFPCHTPFVITEEDYRNYPQERASFVNTVRQCLLENTLCLIGFSGDDPNFLNWIGWVRDQMGAKYAQPIYLISAGSFSTAQQQLLAKRNIIVVDMAQCDGVEKNDHKKALAEFFKFLENKDPNDLDWPISSHENNNSIIRPANRKITVNEMKTAVNFWRERRLSYPGWVVLPHANRINLYFYTSSWLPTKFEDEVNILNDGLDIFYFGELVWRIERCLLPLFDNIVEYCEDMLNKYWPFYDEMKIGDSIPSINFNNSANNALNWSSIRHSWLLIAFALLRYYREEGKSEQWRNLKSILVARRNFLSDEQNEILYYQSYLFALFNIDISGAKQWLGEWQLRSSQPFWKSVRYMAMAEIGQVDVLTHKVSEALHETRTMSKLENHINSKLIISHEAYQIVACQFLKSSIRSLSNGATPEEEILMKVHHEKEYFRKSTEPALSNTVGELIERDKLRRNSTPDEDWNDLKNHKDSERRAEWQGYLYAVREEEKSREQQFFNRRLADLKSENCDPWGELKLLSSGASIYSGYDENRLNAYAMLRFFEDVGLPYHIGNTVIESKTTATNLQYIAKESPFWARATLVRLGNNSNAIGYLFSRDQVRQLDVKDIDQLIYGYLGALDVFHAALNVGNFFEKDCIEIRLAQVLPEVISRLCCKCSVLAKERILVFISDMYASAYKDKYSNINKLVRALITSLSKAEQYNLLPTLLGIPYPNSPSPRTKFEYVSLTQWLAIGNRRQLIKPNIEISAGVVDNLLCYAVDAINEKRDWAIISLIKLYNLNLLDEAQQQRFSSALWNEIDNCGFPKDTDIYKSLFLELPHPVNVDPKFSFKAYVDSDNSHVRGSDNSYKVTQGDIPLVHEVVEASRHDRKFWTHKDALKLLSKVLLWWESDERHLRAENAKNKTNVDYFGGGNEFHKRLARIADIVSAAIGPSLSIRIAKKEKIKLIGLLDDMQEQGLCTLEARAACLHVVPEVSGTLIGFIKDALLSNDKEFEVDALKAILCIASDKKLSDLWLIMFELLIQFIQWSRTASLSEGMWIISCILKTNRAFFPASFEEIIGKRLIRLVQESDYEVGTLGVEINEKIRLRHMAVSLAAKLNKAYENKSVTLVEAISLWRGLSESTDEFSEVKNAWVEKG